ncbi:MAG TPA: hypothetical protein VMB47_09785 [Candidatus Aquilonibacter sp.]|nr:hypothetical protein [Candidatus Aquilonibacter sp.]
MLNLFRNFKLPLALIAVLAFSAATLTQTKADPSQVPVTVTVTALASNFKSPPPIAQEDVSAYSGSNRLDITKWVRAQGSESDLQLAILIDNDLGPVMLGRNIQDLENFINSQSPSTAVGVFYAENGSATPIANFTTNHSQAANAIRLTEGRQGASPSIYLSLTDLVRHWPSSSTGTRREALVIASGFDPLYPGIQDPYASSAVTSAEKAGVDVHVIMVPRGRYAQTFVDNISEGKLIDVTNGSGGQVLFEGAFVPVSLSPFLQELNSTLNNQYLLTFNIARSGRPGGELRPLRVSAEESGVKLYAPQEVLVPGS